MVMMKSNNMIFLLKSAIIFFYISINEFPFTFPLSQESYLMRASHFRLREVRNADGDIPHWRYPGISVNEVGSRHLSTYAGNPLNSSHLCPCLLLDITKLNVPLVNHLFALDKSADNRRIILDHQLVAVQSPLP